MSLTFSIILSSGSSTNRWASYVNKIEPRASMTTMKSVLAMLIIDSACKAALVLYATMNSRPFLAVKVADRYSPCLRDVTAGSHCCTKGSRVPADLLGSAAFKRING